MPKKCSVFLSLACWSLSFEISRTFFESLTCLTRLNRTSLLPSSCNLDKKFALTGHLAQVHLSKFFFLIFLHAGRGKRKGESSGMICNRYKYLSFFCEFLQGFRSSVGRARDFKSIDKRYETRHHQ